ncbi:ThiJ/PfpI family protein [Bacillus cereus B4264]|uniref:ThiJ/PfpI family protein n=1 Tax=Bacillus cereus (strain B4264) TaxID=405532 RepID=B7HI25_BACC4|nr:ThiJ/PfpI family protein [Bacillus cereus B4264]
MEEKGHCLRISIEGGDNMKKALIFLFEGFAEFEVNIASLFLII